MLMAGKHKSPGHYQRAGYFMTNVIITCLFRHWFPWLQRQFVTKKNGDLTRSLNRNRFSLSLLPSPTSASFSSGERTRAPRLRITSAQKHFLITREILRELAGQFEQKVGVEGVGRVLGGGRL